MSVILVILGITPSLKGGEAQAYGGDCKDAVKHPSSVVTFTLLHMLELVLVQRSRDPGLW